MKEEQNHKTAFGSQNSRDTHRHEISFPSQNWSLEMLLRRLKAIDARRDDKFASVMAQRPYCNTSWILEVGPNLTEDEQLNLTLPRASNGSFLTCLMYIPVPWDLDSIIHFGLNYTETCKFGWIYPFANTRSLINEFDLVCGNEPNKENGQTVFLSGILTGSLLFGFLSDKLGRYPIILLSLLGFLIFGFGTAFVSSFYQYLFFRFFVAQASVGYAICSVSLVMEWLVGEHRAQAVILQHCFLTIGFIFLTGLAYKVVHWRLLCLLGGMPMFPLICNIWVLRESPRWLMVRGKVEEAKKVLCYAAEVNKKTIPLSLLNELQIPGKKVAKASILDFCTNQHLFKVVLAIGCVWFTVSYISFTLNFKMNDFGLDVYFVQMVRSIVAVPARLCCIILLEYFGRKWALNLTLFLVTSTCLFLLFLPQEPKSPIILTLMLAEFSMAGTVSIFFIYTAELLPTVLRSTGLGMVSLAWVAGAISSVTIFKQTKTQLPIFFCCLCCVLALCFSSLVPETGSQSLRDSVEYNIRDSTEPKDRNKDVPTVIAEESMSDVVADSEVTKNATLNAVTFKPEENSLLNMTLEVPKMDLPVQPLKDQPP
ncbi:solute carrier family 22 member 14 isoform X3 [Mus caroli]|uniref:Solute carrier family 22 member 14 isoform X3 n=1 Tax=Mus caroli TaxID=10089 RepID=A0A6P5QIU9_MUSCR|nr:solute carrier family 22 member 14 isoform X3 [Mus caroli]